MCARDANEPAPGVRAPATVVAWESLGVRVPGMPAAYACSAALGRRNWNHTAAATASAGIKYVMKPPPAEPDDPAGADALPPAPTFVPSPAGSTPTAYFLSISRADLEWPTSSKLRVRGQRVVREGQGRVRRVVRAVC